MGLREKAEYYNSGLRKKAKLIKEKYRKNIINENDNSYKNNIDMENYDELGLLQKAKLFRSQLMENDGQKKGLLEKAKYYRLKIGSVTAISTENRYKSDILLNDIDDREEVKNAHDAENKIDTLNKKIIQMNTLIEIIEDIQTSFDVEELYQNVLYAMIGQLDKIEYIYIYDYSNEKFKLNTTNNENIEEKEDTTHVNENIVNYLLDHNKPSEINIDNTTLNYTDKEKINHIIKKWNVNFIAPITSDSSVEGLILIKNNNNMSAEDISFIYTICSVAGNKIKNLRQYQYLENVLSFYDTINFIFLKKLKNEKLSYINMLEDLLENLKGNYDILSYFLLRNTEGKTYTPILYDKNRFNRIEEYGTVILNSYIKELKNYSNQIIDKNIIEDESNLKDFFNTYKSEIPDNILTIPLIIENNEIGLLLLIMEKVDDLNVYNSPDFDTIKDIISVCLSLYISKNEKS